MATNDGVLEFFSRQAADETYNGPVVTETPKLDLDIYIGNYQGRTRFDRLLHIGRSSTQLCVDALRAAVAEAKKSNNVESYKLAWSYLRIAAPRDPAAELDQAWATKAASTNAATLKKLTHELDAYRNNLVKESIRMGYDELGKFHESTGNMTAAHDAYVRMRSETATLAQIFETNKKLVRVLVLEQEYGAAVVTLSKMAAGVTPEEEAYFGGFMMATRGLCMLGLGRLEEATAMFTRAPPTDLDCHSDILTPNDVAVHGGLLALATMDRADLQADVLNRASFRYYMSYEPYVRKAISLFVNCRYAACLEMLRPYWADYLLDIHLHPAVGQIKAKIRTKCIKEYCAPFLTISFDTLLLQFGSTREELVEELGLMIKFGDLPHGRLDLEGGYLNNHPPDVRATTMAKAVKFCGRIDGDVLDRVRNMAGYMAEVESREDIMKLQLSGDPVRSLTTAPVHASVQPSADETAAEAVDVMG